MIEIDMTDTGNIHSMFSNNVMHLYTCICGCVCVFKHPCLFFHDIGSLPSGGHHSFPTNKVPGVLYLTRSPPLFPFSLSPPLLSISLLFSSVSLAVCFCLILYLHSLHSTYKLFHLLFISFWIILLALSLSLHPCYANGMSLLLLMAE